MTRPTRRDTIATVLGALVGAALSLGLLPADVCPEAEPCAECAPCEPCPDPLAPPVPEGTGAAP